MLDLIIGFAIMLLFDRTAARDLSRFETEMLMQKHEVQEFMSHQAMLFEDRFAAQAQEIKELRDLLHGAELREASVHAQLEIHDDRLSRGYEPDEDD